MRHVEVINQEICRVLSGSTGIVCFGQNVSLGSCLGGLTKGLPTQNRNMVINTTNSENSLAGMGFGLMLENIDSICFLKQQDFFTLMLDHLVNTWNSVRIKKTDASLTFFSVTVDTGFEGPQSCLNGLSDICSIAAIDGFTISNKDDADFVISKHLVTPGLRLISVSQRLLQKEVDTASTQSALVDQVNCVHQYGNGNQATLVSLNHAFEEAQRVSLCLSNRGITNSLFNTARLFPVLSESIIRHAEITGKLIIFDDTKSKTKPSYRFQQMCQNTLPNCEIKIMERKREQIWSSPNQDRFEINDDSLAESIGRCSC